MPGAQNLAEVRNGQINNFKCVTLLWKMHMITICYTSWDGSLVLVPVLNIFNIISANSVFFSLTIHNNYISPQLSSLKGKYSGQITNHLAQHHHWHWHLRNECHNWITKGLRVQCSKWTSSYKHKFVRSLESLFSLRPGNCQSTMRNDLACKCQFSPLFFAVWCCEEGAEGSRWQEGPDRSHLCRYNLWITTTFMIIQGWPQIVTCFCGKICWTPMLLLLIICIEPINSVVCGACFHIYINIRCYFNN